MRHYFIVPLIAVLLFIVSPAFAETVTFTKEYTYQASDFDSRNSSRTLSLETVKRLLLEELGTYLVGETEIKDMKLTKDQVTTYSAGIVGAEIIDEKWDGKSYWLKAKVSADPKEVEKALKKLVEDKYKTQELEETRKKAAELTKENERLRRELEAGEKSNSRDKEAETKNVRAYEKTITGLNAIEWFEKGQEADSAKRFKDAIDAYTKAIILKPDYAAAYFSRGSVYDNLGRGYCEQAISDETKAIELQYNFAWAYYYRGLFYVKCGLLKSKQKNYPQAISDFTKAIEFQPDFPWAYHHRGLAYSSIGNYKQAIIDYTKAVELKSDYADAYSSRGTAYGELGDQQQEIRDYTKAIELVPEPDNAITYIMRGDTYEDLGNYLQAIDDYTKGIELWPDFAYPYRSRGFAYVKSGNYQQAISDLTIAARLGDKKAQDFLMEKGIQW